MRAKLVVGNWKMNGGLASNARLLARLVEGARDVARPMSVCVPFPYLAQARAALAGSPVAWGAQDVSAHASGAHTGDVAASMVAEFGCRHAIVGHSERRHDHAEADDVVAAKARAALGAGLVPIACVGETLAERDAGATRSVVLRQLEAVLHAVGAEASRLVYAYEPVWAIGTGRTATPDQAQEVHAWLRERLVAAAAPDAPLLYGGSVKAANAAALFAMPDIDGGLVGGASLEAEEFLGIARA
jgi:triosephosphate isomerase